MLKTACMSIFYKIKTPGSALYQMSCVAGGTVIAQILNVVVLPIISRMYSPADFGVMAVYSSVIAISAEISGFRYHYAIPLPKDDRYARALLSLSFIIQIFIVAVISIILINAGDKVLSFLSLDALEQYQLYIPIGVAGIGLYNILLKMSVRNSRFKTIAKTKVSQALGRDITMAAAGALTHGPFGLIIGTIIGQSGGIVTLFRDLLPLNNIFCFKRYKLYRAMVRYKRFPIYNMPFGIVNTLGMYLPQLTLTSYYGASVTGIYAMAALVLSLPSRFIGEAVGSVFVQRASAARYSGSLNELSIRFYQTMLKISIFPVAVLSLSAPLLLAIILGEQWGESGLYAIALIPFASYNLVYSPLNVLYLVFERQKEAFLHETFSVFAKGAVLLWGGYTHMPPVRTICIFSLICFFVSLYRVIFLLKIAGHTAKMVLVSTFRTIAWSALLLMVPAFCYMLGLNILCLITSAIAVIPYTYKTYRDLRELSVL